MMERDYCPPVFDVFKGDEEQIELMDKIFNTLRDSGIAFVEVRKSIKEHTLDVIFNGRFSEEEQEEIMEELRDYYCTE